MDKITRHEPESRRPTDVVRHYIGDLVYGASDGVITTFAIVSGVAGAGMSAWIVLVLGVANLLADGFSMAASNFLAIRSTASAEGVDRGGREPLRHAGATFLAFVVVGAVPLAAFAAPSASLAFPVSCAATGLVLFTVGALRRLVSTKPWFRSGLEMLCVGAVAAAVSYGVGSILRGWVAPV